MKSTMQVNHSNLAKVLARVEGWKLYSEKGGVWLEHCEFGMSTLGKKANGEEAHQCTAFRCYEFAPEEIVKKFNLLAMSKGIDALWVDATHPLLSRDEDMWENFE